MFRDPRTTARPAAASSAWGVPKVLALLVAAALASCGGTAGVAGADAGLAEQDDALSDDALSDDALSDVSGATAGQEVEGAADAWADAADVSPPLDSSLTTGDTESADLALDASAVADGAALPDSADLPDTPDLDGVDVTGGADAAPEVAAPPDSGPQSCFYDAPPAPDAWVTDVLPPAAPCPLVEGPLWFEGVPVPPPTLPLKIGLRDAAGDFQPLNNGDWVPLKTAMQGGFHLDLIPQVVLAGQTATPVVLQLQSFAVAECEEVANATSAVGKFVEDKGSFEYTLPAGAALTVFGANVVNIKNYCGIWIHVWWRVRIPSSDKWGEVVLALRTYNATGIVPGVGGN